MLLGLLLDEGLLVAALASGGKGSAGEATAGGVHALEAVALLNVGHGGSLVAAVDTSGCGLLSCVSFRWFSDETAVKTYTASIAVGDVVTGLNGVVTSSRSVARHV